MKKQYIAQGQEESQKLLLDPYDNNRSSSANEIVSQEKIAKSEVHPEPNILSRSQNHGQQIELIQTEPKKTLGYERQVRGDKNSSNFRSGFSDKVSEKNGTQDFIKNIMIRTDSTLNNSGKVIG